MSDATDLTPLVANLSGRVRLQLLAKLANTCEQAVFRRLVQRPVLAGSSIQMGSLTTNRNARKEAVNQTAVFQVHPADDTAPTSDCLTHSIYTLIKSPDAGRAPTLFTIGRVNQNDLIMPDLAISKRHAIIEMKNGDYVIRDCQSTNGTWLNGVRLARQATALHDGDILAFARYEFTFIYPDSLYQKLIAGQA